LLYKWSDDGLYTRSKLVARQKIDRKKCVTGIIDGRDNNSNLYSLCTERLLTTGWTVRGSNLGGCEIYRICPDQPWGPPSLLYNG